MKTIESLTQDQQKDLKLINKYINKAVRSWTENNNSRGLISDNSDYWYNKALNICKKYGDIEFDYPGLYPTYEITINSEHYTEYNTENMFKRINNFWNTNR
jgi:hypothetical protein